MKRMLGAAALLLAACNQAETKGPEANNNASAAPAAAMSLTRLDCGHAEFKDMNGFFSDRPGVYPPGPGKVTDSCYLIRHGDQQMVWDTGFPAETLGKPMTRDGMTAQIDRTLADQLQELGVKPEDVDVLGISHMHGDHIGQAAQFTKARLVIGKLDFEKLAGTPEDSLKAWRGEGKPVTLTTGDTDLFGDGSVLALYLPGHTPAHMALLLRLKSGPVLLTGDLYHSTIAREKKAVPSFNTSREQTLASMEKFEKLARETGAKVVIQHEPGDIAKLPAFPRGGAVKALLSHEPGPPETLRLSDLPEPVAGPGELLVRVHACAINYPDVLIIEDKYQMRPPRPFAPGGEIAGEVIAVGEGVEGWQIGERLVAVIGFGGLAEMITVPAKAAFRLPEGRSFEDGAALLLTYATSIHGLYDRGRLLAGQTLLVLGAAGGVGLAAVELGKAKGARVIAAVSSEEKAAAAREAGADEAIVYPRGPFDKDGQKALADLFKAAVGPNGANVIYDPVGGDYAEPALRAIGWEGRYLVVGFPAGIPKLPLNLTLLKSCDVCGVFWGAFAARDPKANAAHVAELFRLWEEGKIAPKVSATYPLSQAGEAIAAMAARQAIGKLVVTI